MWIDCGTYWQDTSEQRTEEWKKNRLGRVTMSILARAIQKGYRPSEESAAETAKKIKGEYVEVFTEQEQARLDHGTEMEPIAREWYEAKYLRPYGYKAVEVGLAVPKWEHRIGASLDGDIFRVVKDASGKERDVETGGCLEIKCPQKMYPKLQDYIFARSVGWVPPPGYHMHIKDEHWYQMQGCMAVRGKKWCDYVVYCTSSGEAFVERVYFDPVEWEITLRDVRDFLDRYEINCEIPKVGNDQTTV